MAEIPLKLAPRREGAGRLGWLSWFAWLGLGRLSRGSLKTRLAVTSALVIGLCVAVVVNHAMRDAQQRAEQQIKDSNLGAGRLANALASRLLEQQLVLSALARQWAADSARNPGLRETEFLTSQMAARTLFDRLFIISPDGQIRALSSRSEVSAASISVADQPFFSEAARDARPRVSEPVRNALGDEALEIFLTLPVMKDGHVSAIVAAALTLPATNLLTDALRHDAGLLNAVDTVLINAQGRIISHPDKSLLMSDAAAEPRLAEAVQQWISQGRPMEADPWTLRTGGDFVAMAAVPGADWMVIRYAPAEQLLGRAAAARLRILYFGLAVVGVGALLIFLVMARMLSPMQRLENRALLLLDPAAPADLPWPQASGEIGDLTTVFEHVIQELATSRAHTEEMLNRMQAIMAHAPIGISFTRRGVFELASDHYCEVFGYKGADLVGQHHSVLFESPEIYRTLADRIGTHFVAGKSFREEVQFKRRDGTLFWGLLLGAAVHAGNPLAGSIWVVVDATEMRQRREKLSWTATHDALTDLLNRREFEERLRAILADRRHAEDVSVLFIDLDGFKAVNDTGGHAAGDEILRQVSHVLTERVREQDTVARLGGDEFAILLRACSLAQALAVAEQIRARVQARRLDWQGHDLGVTTSIGAVSLSEGLPTMESVVAAADEACYEAKHAGRNTVRAYRAPATTPALKPDDRGS